MDTTKNCFEKHAQQRKIMISIMKQGGYYQRVMDAGPELDRVKQFLCILESSTPPIPADPYQIPNFLPIFPGLQAKPFHERQNDPVAHYLENQLSILKKEILTFKEQCLTNQNLTDALTWKVYPLWYLGVNLSFMNQELVPLRKIVDALPRSAIKFPLAEAIISWLEPGAHLPAHCSTDNLRLRYSLGVVIDDFCQLRVGANKKTWTEGECIIFEDCFEHEAWNGNQPRAVLIVDTWHPDLTAIEIEALTAGFGKREIREVIYHYRPIEAMKKIIFTKFQQEDRNLPASYWDHKVTINIPSLREINDWKDISVLFG